MIIDTITQAMVNSDSTLWKVRAILNGGPGSGNFGHVGIPGQRGGSAAGGGGGGGYKINIPEQNFIIQDANLNLNLNEFQLNVNTIESRGYTPEESNALMNYKGIEGDIGEYKNITGGLIKGNLNKQDLKTVKNIDSAIDKSIIKNDLDVYHGMGKSEAEIFKSAEIGSIFYNKGYYSTSTDINVAQGFGLESKQMLKFSLKSGGHAFSFGDGGYESEVLLPRNQKYLRWKND